MKFPQQPKDIKMAKKSNQDHYTDIANKVIKALEKAEVKNGKWERPWASLGGLPQSIDGHIYTGMNPLILAISSMDSDYSSNRWGTYNAWKKRGVQVQKGEKSTIIYKWYSFKPKADEGDEQKEIWNITAYPVFAAEQTDYDLSQLGELPNGAIQITSVEDAISSYMYNGPALKINGTKACYSPLADVVSVPKIEAFKSTEGYYSTLLHEIIHSTGHKTRLDRDQTGQFGTEDYAYEELIAEFGSAILCGHLGVNQEPDDQHALYIKSWIKALKDDPSLIQKSCSQAAKASDLILNTKQLQKAA